MNKSVFRCLYYELMLQSDNGTAEIERYWMVLTEASKCSGQPKDEVREAFYLFEERGLIQKADEEKHTYTVTQVGVNSEKAKAIFSPFSE